MNEVTDPIIDDDYIVVNSNLPMIMCQNYHNFLEGIGNLLLLER